MASNTTSACPFCHLDVERIVSEDEFLVIYKDGFPVSLGHTLIIPKRHCQTLFELTETEQFAVLGALKWAKAFLDEKYAPDGYNVGINNGAAAGQTVPHLHIHLIPRYIGDCEDPRGGVRWVLAEKAKYWD